MKRKEIIHLLLIAVAMMMLAACASSRRVFSNNHQETKDSVHKQVAVSDSAAIKVLEDKHVSATSSESGEYEETIQENITESTDSSGNKQKTTQRTTHRKGTHSSQSSYDERLQRQQQEINQMQKTIDSLSDMQEKNTEETRKATWQQTARKNAFALFLILVVVLVLTTFKKHNDHGQGQEKKE